MAAEPAGAFGKAKSKRRNSLVSMNYKPLINSNFRENTDIFWWEKLCGTEFILDFLGLTCSITNEQYSPIINKTLAKRLLELKFRVSLAPLLVLIEAEMANLHSAKRLESVQVFSSD